MVDVVTELARYGVLGEVLQAYDLVLMSETIDGCRIKFWKGKKPCDNKDLKLNHLKSN